MRIRTLGILAIAAAACGARGQRASADNLYFDNFNVPDGPLDSASTAGRISGTLAGTVALQSQQVEQNIVGGQLQLLNVNYSGTTSVRFNHNYDWSTGAAGAAILAAGGMTISFDWTAPENSTDQWISYCVGLNPGQVDQAYEIVNGKTDSGFLLRDNGGTQSFALGSPSGTDASFNAASLTHHVNISYSFNSWADGSPVTLVANVDGTIVVTQNFTWSGNNGVQYMELASQNNGNNTPLFDNLCVTTNAAPTAAPTWLTTGSGSFYDATNWLNGYVPNGVDATANFTAAVSSGTATVTGPSVTLGTLNFGSANPYNLAVGTVTLSSSTTATVTVASGSQTISGLTNLASNTTISTAGGAGLTLANVAAAAGTTLTKTGAGSLTISGASAFAGNLAATGGTTTVATSLQPVVGSLSVSGSGTSVLLAAPTSAGAVTVAGEFSSVFIDSGASVQVVDTNRSTSLQQVLITSGLGGSGTLDLTNNDLIVRGGDPNAIQAAVAAWYNGGLLNGPSTIISSTAGGSGPDALATLAVVPNSILGLSTFDGVPVTASDVLVKYTYLGDTDLNGVVDASDLANLLAGLNGGLTGWVNGDLNYDGVVNSVDLGLLLNSLANQGASFGNSGGAGPSGAVPEPGAVIPVAMIGLTLLRRRS